MKLNSVATKFALWVIVVFAISSVLIALVIYTNMKNITENDVNTKIQLAINNVQNLTAMYEENLSLVNDQIIGAVNDKLKTNINIAYSVVQNYYNQYQEYMKQNPMADSNSVLKQYQEQALKVVGMMKYDNGVGYIWIHNTDYIMLEHPEKSLIGKNIKNIADKNGEYLFQKMNEVCAKKGEGFVDYLWPKPGKDVPQPKRSFVKEFKPWGWILGTGEYIDDQMALINQKQNELFQAYRKQVLKVKVGKDSYPVILYKKDGKLLFKVYTKPEYEGKPVPLTDQKGHPLASGIKGNSGLVHYVWPMPNSSTLAAKTLWYEYVPDLNWYITFAAYDSEIYSGTRSIMIFVILSFIIAAAILLSLIFILLKFIITSKLKVLPKAMEDFSKGDLTVNIPEPKSNDEIALIIKSTNAAVKGLKNLVKSLKEKGQNLLNSNEKVLKSMEITEKIAEAIRKDTSGITSDVQNVSANIEEVNAGQEEFASGMQRIADETNSMAEEIKDIVEKLSKMSQTSDNALKLSNDLGTNADNTLQAVNKMTDKVNLITEFAQSISSISEQTNLLALNAAIEAARAGESGKGFAVIADEIRELANESKITAEKISNSIGEIKTVSDVALKEVENTNQNIKDTIEHIVSLIDDVKNIDESINTVSGSVNSVSASVEESNATAEELASAITNIASLFEAIVTKTEEVDEEIVKQEAAADNLSVAANTLNDVIELLNKEITKFKIND